MKSKIKFAGLSFLVSILFGVSAKPSPIIDERGITLKKSLCKKFRLNKDVLAHPWMAEASTTKNNEYDVPEYIFTAASIFYNAHRNKNELGLLEYLFSIMPKEHREAAFNFLNAWAVPSDPTLAEIRGLKSRLMKLPYKPHNTNDRSSNGKQRS